MTADLRSLREPEQLARFFHATYERLAPSFGYETRTETREFDPTSNNGRLMIAVCAEISRALAALERERDEALEWQRMAFVAHPNIDLDIDAARAKEKRAINIALRQVRDD